MNMEVVRGILIPFVGTSLGAACVFFMRGRLNAMVQRALTGFAAGVMVAASVWSLLLPAIEQSVLLGRWAFLPAASGLWVGVLFLLVLDELVPHLNLEGGPPEGVHTPLKRTTMLALAVTLHNVPDGRAVGVVYAALLQGSPGVTAAGALALAAGIAIQNVPEGAIISLPLGAEGMGKGRACFWGVLSGAVEPVAAALTLLAAAWVGPVMPCLLSFAAGAMFYVVVEDLVPEMAAGEHSNLATLTFALGFTLMLALDVAFG
jgi:ZIP family zinc transporter